MPLKHSTGKLTNLHARSVLYRIVQNSTSYLTSPLPLDIEGRLPPLHTITFGVKTQSFDNAGELLSNWPYPEQKAVPKLRTKSSEGLFGIPPAKPKPIEGKTMVEEEWKMPREKEEVSSMYNYN